ncbi:50S ribosomal protein L5 [Christensenellaceae bacterium NSJ-53]|uniref:Large ribosomal subunit protein uL5 n=1 Tax=Gehongia tenuis TaxID=2763655 RepID=A0A926D593_9FIRM|nr:50S ribosomal protein L5 [Gehongia tenuis]
MTVKRSACARSAARPWTIEPKGGSYVEQPRLKEKYLNEVVPALQQKFGYKNVNEIPKLDKVVLNMGLGDVKDNPKSLEAAVADLTQIAGQKPLITKAKKSVANFKVRTGMNVGAKVTLRSSRMYEFVDKLFSIALPRVRDFRGVSANSFDGRGNYAMGIKEQLIFPEIDYDKVDKVRGLDVIFVTTAKTDEEARELLRLLGMPFAQ